MGIDLCDTRALKESYPKGRDWKADVRSGQVPDAKMTFALSLVNIDYDVNGENQQLVDEAARLYALQKTVAVN